MTCISSLVLLHSELFALERDESFPPHSQDWLLWHLSCFLNNSQRIPQNVTFKYENVCCYLEEALVGKHLITQGESEMMQKPYSLGFLWKLIPSEQTVAGFPPGWKTQGRTERCLVWAAPVREWGTVIHLVSCVPDQKEPPKYICWSRGSWHWGIREERMGWKTGDRGTATPVLHPCTPSACAVQPEQASRRHQHLHSSPIAITWRASLKSWWFHCGFGTWTWANLCCKYKDHTITQNPRLEGWEGTSADHPVQPPDRARSAEQGAQFGDQLDLESPQRRDSHSLWAAWPVLCIPFC